MPDLRTSFLNGRLLAASETSNMGTNYIILGIDFYCLGDKDLNLWDPIQRTVLL